MGWIGLARTGILGVDSGKNRGVTFGGGVYGGVVLVLPSAINRTGEGLTRLVAAGCEI